ncbi:MAG: histidine kinase [Burkholderiales bacterium]|jgi:two-component system sensor histidine kinase AlgZ|nr:histidine kinase [Burkholderiales bacterium]
MTVKDAIGQPAAASRAEAAAPTPQRVIPDGCNIGVVLRVALGVNAVVALAVLLGHAQWGPAWVRFVELSAVLEPALLMTLLAWCALRRFLPQLPLVWQRLLGWATPAVCMAAILLIVGPLGPDLSNSPRWAALLVALAFGVAIQHYFELRARAFSPAVTEARFQALQSRIRPHFFFNSLNAVIAVVRSDPPRAERMLEAVAELFRAVMGDVRKLVPLEQELDLCRRYVEIEQTRLGERLQVEWDVGAVHPRARVPQLLLQPVIENAVRYGAERLAGDCRIVVRVRQLGFRLEIFVSNPVAKDPLQREGNQIGLANIRGRLALIYDLEAELTTRVRHDRFELTMSLPVEKRANG